MPAGPETDYARVDRPAGPGHGGRGVAGDSDGLRVNGVRLHHEESGGGAPILCIHGAGSTALAWAAALPALAGLGRVIAYDRRGCGRSERPVPYEATTVAEHADDAAALLRALGAAPAVVIGRSFGGWIATELALRDPESLVALVLLEPDAPGLSPTADAWIAAFSERMRRIAAGEGVDALGRALIGEVAGPDAWASLPAEVRDALTANGPALLAELRGYEASGADVVELARIRAPTLLVCARDSPPEFHEPVRALAAAIPGARLEEIGGGHLIDPAAPQVLGFIREVLGRT